MPICLAIGCTVSNSYLGKRKGHAQVAKDAIGCKMSYNEQPRSPLDGLAQPLATLAKEELRDMLGQHVLAGKH